MGCKYFYTGYIWLGSGTSALMANNFLAFVRLSFCQGRMCLMFETGRCVELMDWMDFVVCRSVWGRRRNTRRGRGEPDQGLGDHQRGTATERRGVPVHTPGETGEDRSAGWRQETEARIREFAHPSTSSLSDVWRQDSAKFFSGSITMLHLINVTEKPIIQWTNFCALGCVFQFTHSSQLLHVSALLL